MRCKKCGKRSKYMGLYLQDNMTWWGFIYFCDPCNRIVKIINEESRHGRVLSRLKHVLEYTDVQRRMLRAMRRSAL